MKSFSTLVRKYLTANENTTLSLANHIHVIQRRFSIGVLEKPSKIYDVKQVVEDNTKEITPVLDTRIK